MESYKNNQNRTILRVYQNHTILYNGTVPFQVKTGTSKCTIFKTVPFLKWHRINVMFSDSSRVPFCTPKGGVFFGTPLNLWGIFSLKGFRMCLLVLSPPVNGIGWVN